jgi:hypothetical protein
MDPTLVDPGNNNQSGCIEFDRNDSLSESEVAMTYSTDTWFVSHVSQIFCARFFYIFHSGEIKDSPNLGLYAVSLDTGFLTSPWQVRNNLPETKRCSLEILHSY